MKKLLTLISAVLLSAGVAVLNAAENPAPVAQFHFIGMQNLAGNTNAAKLNQIWKMPETIRLRGMVSQKLTAASEEIFPQTLKGKASNLQPLFEDLLLNESIIEVVDSTSHQAQLNVAAQLDDKRSAFWCSNLLAATSSKPANTKNWSAKLSPETSLTFTREGKWTCVMLGKDGEKKFLSELSVGALLKKTNWLEGEINWTTAEQLLGISIPLKITYSKITVVGRADNLYPTIESTCSEKIGWKNEPWKFPSILKQPLASFTAMQPLANLCKPSRFFDQIGLNPLTRQIIFWSYGDLPFQTFGSMASSDATNELKSIGPKLISNANPILQRRHSGQLGWDSAERRGILWTNVPLIYPFLRPHVDDSNQFIIGGLFPNAPRKSSAPVEIFQKVSGSPQMVYYDWESTQNRIGHWDMITRVLPVLSPEQLTSGGPLRLSRNVRLPAHVWIRAVAPLSGITVTEATITGPTQLTLRRKSTLGFTGMELMFLAGLLDEPNFPFFHKTTTSSQPRPK